MMKRIFKNIQKLSSIRNKLLKSKLLLLFLFTFGAFFLNNLGYSQSSEVNTPNIFMIIADDMNWTDSEAYGHPDVKTPSIKRLSEEGMTFEHAYSTASMCAPFRMSMYTGLHPVRNGAYPNSSQIYPGGKSLVHHFSELGYRVALAGKTHVGPEDSFPFEYHEEYEAETSIPESLKEIIDAGEDQPFFLIVAHNSPHLPWTEGDRSLYDKDALTIPDFLIDTPLTREELVKYYAEVSHFDESLGAYLDYLEQAGVSDNTIVLFSSEQGSAFPFAKWTTYDMGLKTQFIVRWPNVITPGSRTDALVQTVDVVPTLLEAVGADPDTVDTGIPGANMDKGFDGRSFINLLTGDANVHRDYVFGVQTTRGIANGSEAYPTRSVRSKKYKYILNPNYQSPFLNNQVVREGGGFVYTEWERYAMENPEVADRVSLYKHRPMEELYEIQSDPYELNNLSLEPEYIAIKNEMRKILLTWMQSQGDTGMGTEMRTYYRRGR